VNSTGVASFQCWTYATRLWTVTTTYSSTYTFSAVFDNYTAAFPVNIGTAGNYAVTLTCLLPPNTSGFTITGVSD